MTAVLDAWAVLCLLQEEGPTARRVHRLLTRQRPVMSWVNMAEVAYVLRRAHGPEEADRTVRDLQGQLEVEDATGERALAAAALKADLGLPLADAFAAATAMAHEAQLWTGDPDLLGGGVLWDSVDLRDR